MTAVRACMQQLIKTEDNIICHPSSQVLLCGRVMVDIWQSSQPYTSDSVTTFGLWPPKEKQHYINHLEALKCKVYHTVYQTVKLYKPFLEREYRKLE